MGARRRPSSDVTRTRSGGQLGTFGNGRGAYFTANMMSLPGEHRAGFSRREPVWFAAGNALKSAQELHEVLFFRRGQFGAKD